ncbi:IC domain protein, HAD ATPase, P-type family, partial [Teladorsagia circumcincta]
MKAWLVWTRFEPEVTTNHTHRSSDHFATDKMKCLFALVDMSESLTGTRWAPLGGLREKMLTYILKCHNDHSEDPTRRIAKSLTEADVALHRAANLYFIFIVVLNMIIGAFGKYISLMPISFVLGVTAIKDAFEDYRRYKSDQKVNHSTCRVWDSSQGRYRKLEWKHILVGDFVHLSHDEIIPADMLLLRSSDANGICYVDTCNLDGESNLKQRQAIRAMGKFHNPTVPLNFSPDQFKYKVCCEEPTTDVYKFEGRLETMEGGPPLPREFTILAKENVLLRGCVVKNTDFVEGIVLYAGRDTKAMLNNNGPRYK